MADREGSVITTIQNVAPIRPERTPTIKIVSVSKRRKNLLVSNGSELIYLLEDERIAHTFRFSSPVISVALEDCGGNTRIFAATKDGNIFSVPLPDTLTKKKRSKKNPEAPLDARNQGATKSAADGDDDIFAGLLGCSSSGNASTETSNKLCHNSQCITTIAIGSAVLCQPGLISILPIRDSILCCRASEHGCVLSVFLRMAHGGKDPDQLAYTPLPAFRTTLQTPSPISNFHGSRNHCYSEHKPQMCYVQPSNACGTSSSTSCRVINRSFFNKLFGSEASLLDTPVVLFGSKDGQICFWPVNSFTSSSMGTDSQTSESKCASVLRLLYHLEQEVSAIHLANLPCQGDPSQGSSSIGNESERSDTRSNKASSCNCNAVVFVGHRDKIAIASQSRSQSQKGLLNPISFTEHTILGPVVCSCLSSNGDTLIHSTGKEIFITRLSIFNDDMDIKSALSTLSSIPVSLNCIGVQIPNIFAVCCAPGKKHKSSEAKKQDRIVALAVSGKLLQFCVPELQDGDSLNDSSLSPQVAGQKVKDFLCEIEDQSAELSRVNATIEIEDKILKELNTVIHIACEFTEIMGELRTGTAKEQDIASLSCSFTPSITSHDSNGNCTVNLHCRVANQGHLALSSCWSLMVRIQGKEDWLQNDGGETCTVGYSVPIQSLDTGSFMGLDIPLSKSLSSSFHIVAEAHLYCSLNTLVSDLRGESTAGAYLGEQVQDIVIPIKRQVFDVLHFVQPYVVGSCVSVQDRSHGSMQELLQTLTSIDSKLHATRKQSHLACMETRTHAEQSLPGMPSAVFQLSQNAVSFMKGRIQTKLAQSLGEREMMTTDVSVLYFILMDSSIALQQIRKDSPSISLQTVSGNYAAIRVNSVPPQQLRHTTEQTTPGICDVEVTLQCASVPLLCRLHEAVLSRLKPVMTRDSGECLMQTHKAQRTLERLQKLQDDVMLLEDAMSRRQAKHPQSDLKQKLWAAYEELRHVVLLI